MFLIELFDSAGMNLECTTESKIPGQSNLLNISSNCNNSAKYLRENDNLGLAHLLKDETCSHAEPNFKCNIIMVSNNQSSNFSA